MKKYTYLNVIEDCNYCPTRKASTVDVFLTHFDVDLKLINFITFICAGKIQKTSEYHIFLQLEIILPLFHDYIYIFK